jgi:hypothetical protein
LDGAWQRSAPVTGVNKTHSPSFFSFVLPNFPLRFSGVVIGATCAIMAGIFILQRFGTSKIGIAFAPILSTFFLVNAAIGIYNIQKWDTTIFKVSFGLCVLGLSLTRASLWSLQWDFSLLSEKATKKVEVVYRR